MRLGHKLIYFTVTCACPWHSQPVAFSATLTKDITSLGVRQQIPFDKVSGVQQIFYEFISYLTRSTQKVFDKYFSCSKETRTRFASIQKPEMAT